MRIACISDTHLTVPDPNSQSLFPRHLDGLPREERAALYERMRGDIELAYRTCLSWLTRHGRLNPWDTIIHLGDVTGGYGEAGVAAHSCAEVLLRGCERELNAVACRRRFCIGNHDLGYAHIGSLDAGLNLASIELCETVCGPLYWSIVDHEILLLGICSSFAEYKGSEEAIRKRSAVQREFVGDTLSEWDGPWIFFSHSPASAGHLAKEIAPHLGNLDRMVTGDLHDPRKARFIRGVARTFPSGVFRSETRRVNHACLKRWTLCPSTAPLGWSGYGLLVLTTRDRAMNEEEILVPIASWPEEALTASFLRCTWWCVKPKPKGRN